MASSAVRARFCTRDEFLLFVDQFDCQFTQEAELRPMSLEDAVAETEDTTLRIIRMDHTTWTGEDVSEELADMWLSLHAPSPDDENILPDYVCKSDVWQDYIDAYESGLIDNNQTEARLDEFDLGIGRFAP